MSDSSSNQNASRDAGLGRLVSFGLQESWQVAFLLPDRWQDLRNPVREFTELTDGDTVVLAGRIARPPKRIRARPPRMTFTVADEAGRLIGSTLFGDTRDLRIHEGMEVMVTGSVKQLDNRLWLNNPEIVSPAWAGRMRPKYPGKHRVISPDKVRARVFEHIKPALPIAAAHLDRQLAEVGEPLMLMQKAGLPTGWTLERLLAKAHLPDTPEQGEWAQRLLETLASLVRVGQARATTALPERDSGIPITPEIVSRVVRAIPFDLDEGQANAVADLTEGLSGTRPIRHLISGDVGSGKTAVFAAAAVACAYAGARVAIMTATAPLASQIHAKLLEWWPEVPAHTVTGDRLDSEQGLPTFPILVGTTALLHQDVGSLDVVIVDEQQKFSRAQREALCKTGREHLIEATATCIPRSMALVKFGGWQVSRLSGNHVDKTIHTRIIQRDTRSSKQARALMADVEATIRGGGQVFFIYPLREDNGNGGTVHEQELRRRQAASSAYELWERKFPGRVRHIDGKMSDHDKVAALQDMAESRAAVLIATSVVEVGIDLPNVRRVVVVNPERLGLTTLHQIRGRLARSGGTGHFDLLLMSDISERSMQRLEALKATNDGFRLTELDMEMRGVGNLSAESDRQTGADETLLFGRPATVEALKNAADVLS